MTWFLASLAVAFVVLRYIRSTRDLRRARRPPPAMVTLDRDRLN